jgi:transposase
VKQIPVKADIEAQETFKTEILEPLVEQAQAGKLHLFFVDAAHFVMLPFLGYLYSLTVRFIKAASGRQRFSVLGALNAVTKEVVAITDHGYINAVSVCALLQKLHDLFQNLPIVVIRDNARYQRCALVIETARKLGIQIIFLPPYSPNLNLIERLWKFVKKKTLYNQYYAHYKQFHEAISNCLKQTGNTYKQDLDTLLVANFQSFKNTTIQP